MQVDFVENVTTKINCLRKPVYWPYNQLFAQHVFGSMGEHIQLQLFLTTFLILMASMLRMSSSKNILQYLDSTVHQFQEVVIDFSDGPES